MGKAIMANGQIPPLPPGFTLDEAQQQGGQIPPLPPGFTLDQQQQESSVKSPLSTVSKIEKAFQDIPGAPALSELAQSVNRSVLGTIDFLGPDTINAVLQLSGSDDRVPTLTESILGDQQDFLEPGLGRETIRATGDIVPAALGIGQVLRTAASKLPAFTSGETTGTGLLRQFGKATPTQDVALGSVAAAGQEAGREAGGETGATIGAIAAPIAAVPLVAAKQTASKLIREAVPSIKDIKNTARGIYQSLDNSGTRIASNQFDDLSDDIVATLQKEGSDIDLTPQTNAVIRRLTEEKGTEKTLTNIDTLRKVAKGAADSNDKNERRLGSIAVNKIDDFLDNLGSEAIVGGREAGQAFKSARRLWQQAAKAEEIDAAVTQAENVASGFENGIRVELRKIITKINKGKLRGYTPAEKKSLEKVVQGTKASNFSKFLGKFGVLDGLTSRSLTTLGGIGVAGAAGAGPLAVAVPLVGQVSGALAERLTLNNARMASQIVRAGKNGAEIARVYLKNTPQNQRSASELAELFLKGEVPLDSVNLNTVKPLIADAAVIASIAKQNDKKEPQEQAQTEQPQQATQ